MSCNDYNRDRKVAAENVQTTLWFGYGFVLASVILFLTEFNDALAFGLASAAILAYAGLSLVVIRGCRLRTLNEPRLRVLLLPDASPQSATGGHLAKSYS